MGAERWRHAAEPTTNGEWRFARLRVRTGRVAPAEASMQASRPLVHSITGAGLGPLGFPAPRRARVSRVQRGRRGGARTTSCAGAPAFKHSFV
jgi:hypothetical protein